MADQCSSCLYGQTQQTFGDGIAVRICRNASPIPINMAAGPTPVLWPPVEDTDWCGEGADVTTLRPFSIVVTDEITVVAKLPASPPDGTRMMVSDSSINNPNVGQPVSGGGSNVVPVYYDGKGTWRIG